MRAFIAINLSDTLKEELVGLQQRLDEKVKGIRWLKPDQLHITMKFLGEIDTDEIAFFAPFLAELGKRMCPFHITFSGLGCFPNNRYPRVVWIGVDEGAEQLSLLSAGFEEVFSFEPKNPLQPEKTKKGSDKFKKKDDFIPHLTLGRRVKKEKVKLAEGLLKEKWRCNNFLHVDAFCLMKSTLRSSGAEYNLLQRFPLHS